MRFLFSGRLRWVGLVVVVAVVAGGGAALAAYPQDSVTVYTGCLNSGGQIGSVAVGTSPAKPCASTDTLVHLSGGTITQVTAGTGLTGGGSNGYVTVSIDSKYQLPQSSCSAGQFVASDGSGGWSCKSQKTYSGADFALSNQSCGAGQFVTGFDSSGVNQCANDQTYSSGTGLNLSGNTFSLSSGYQLPQSCSNGQVATSNGDNTWSCHNSVGGLSDYTVHSGPYDIGGFDFGDTESTSAWCNYGDIATGGGFYRDNADIDYSDPTYNGGGEGWYVQASTGAFASGHFEAFVKCLHIG
jgi:hypothetical protein